MKPMTRALSWALLSSSLWAFAANAEPPKSAAAQSGESDVQIARKLHETFERNIQRAVIGETRGKDRAVRVFAWDVRDHSAALDAKLQAVMNKLGLVLEPKRVAIRGEIDEGAATEITDMAIDALKGSPDAQFDAMFTDVMRIEAGRIVQLLDASKKSNLPELRAFFDEARRVFARDLDRAEMLLAAPTTPAT